MNARTITVVFRAEVAQFKRDVESVGTAVKAVATTAQSVGQQGAKGFGNLLDQVGKNEQHLSKLSTTLGLVGLGVTGLAAAAIGAFAGWDAKMAQVQSLAHANAADMARLRDASKGFADEFGVSASQAADAEIELTKAGVSTKDMLNGALKGALTLASAGQLDVADATSIAASTMTQFNLQGGDVVHIADLLAAGADKALGSVSDLGQGLKFVGPVAASLGVSIEPTIGVLSLFAQNGILAEQAGTGLRGVLQALVSPSQQAQKVMDAYGITMFDTQGKFIGLNGLAGQLHDKLGALTQAQQASALGMIFGNQQVTAATILMKGGADAVDQWTKSVDDQGFAAGQASGKLNSLNGDLQKLQASFQNVLISGGSGANDTLRTMAQTATVLVDELGRIPGPVVGAITVIAGAAGLTALGVAGLAKLVTWVRNTQVSFAALEWTIKGVSLATLGVGAAVAVATLGFTSWASAQAKVKRQTDDITQSLDQQTAAITDNTRATIYNNLQENGAIDAAKKLGVSLTDLVDAAIDPSSAAYQRLSDQTNAAQQSVENMHKGLGNLGAINDASTRFNDFTKVMADVNGQSNEVAKSQQKVKDQVAAGVGPEKDYMGALQETTGAVAQQVDALGDLVKAMGDAAGIALSVRDAQAGLEQSYDDATDAIKKNGKTLDITTKAGRDNQAALDDIAKSGYDLITALEKQGATETTLQGTMQTTRDHFIATATQMGLTSDQAAALADQLNLIPKNIHTTATLDATGAYQQLATLNAALDQAAGRHVTIPYQANLMPNLPPGHADGGPIFGPGTGTSDSILSWLSNGEHVWTAAEVAGAGGHAAVELLRAGARGGLGRYANGGSVQYGGNDRPLPRFAVGGPVMAAAARAGGGGGVALNINGPIYARDDQAVVDRLLTKARDAVATYGINYL